jgi:glutathione S-transferase
VTAYTLIIGTQNISSWSLRAFLALKATGVPFDMVKIRLRQPDSKAKILEFSPSGKVPVLMADGRALAWDSLAICTVLADRHPGAGLWPDDAETRAMAMSYAAEMHGGFPDLRDQLGLDFARQQPMPELREETKTQIARVIAAWDSALEKSGGDFLFGRFGVADCMYAPVVSRFRTYGVEGPARVAAYMTRIWNLPGMQEWLVDCEQEVAGGTHGTAD